MTRTNAAIAYHDGDYTTHQPLLVGRHSATSGFLRAFVRHAEVDRYYAYARSADQFAAFERQVTEWSRQTVDGSMADAHVQTDRTGAETVWIPIEDTSRLAEPGCLYVSDPRLAPFAWQRRYSGSRRYSLCSVNHTLVETEIMQQLGDLLTAPVQSWDALVCTSPAAKAVIVRLLDGWADYLCDRIGATAPDCVVQLPVIPLGVDADAWAPTPERLAAGRDLRSRRGVGASDIVILFAGRLSYLDKAHPLPMFAGAEEAVRRTGRSIHLFLIGQYAHPSMREHFIEAARTFCPSVPVHLLDGRQSAVYDAVWNAADVFCSLSDNIQETFGLTPLEAMAAGLPVVASDWDGYRASVIDGETGFLIPTLAPPAGTGDELAFRYESGIDGYGSFCGYTALCTAVDIDATAGAFVRLVEDAELRRRMGEAGMRRVRAHYDWPLVIGQYQELWAELAARRAVDTELLARMPDTPANPLRDDPFRLYADFPTAILSPDDVLQLGRDMTPARITQLGSAAMNRYAQPVLASEDETVAVIRRLAAGPCRVADLLAPVALERRERLWRTLVWLVKVGIARA